MRVLVIRHSHAVPQTGGMRDAERPLTAEGERRFQAAARGLARLVTPDALFTSPLVRARQTAAILATACAIEATPDGALASGAVDDVFGLLANQPPEATVALVSHEPTVSMLVAEIVGARSAELFAFTPGAAAFLEVFSIRRRSGRLLWFIPDAVAASLRANGGSGAPPSISTQ